MTKDNQNPAAPVNEEAERPVSDTGIDEFFQRLPGNFRWPKPNAEAVAAAVEAIHRMSGSAVAAQDLASAGGTDAPPSPCSVCDVSVAASARFCGSCGAPNAPVNHVTVTGESAASSRYGAQHHYHHHYHHLVPGQGSAHGAPSVEPESVAPRGKAPGPAGTSVGGRAEASARQVVQDWAQACNTKHIDDLLELYAADATLIRSSVPPVRSLPAIREFLISLLEAGLGDVEMESLRVEVMGEIAIDLGRCKMLVPVAMGKRREERGKYLIVLVRQPSGTWKILADCWSSDLAVNAPVAQESAARKGNDPVPPLRKPR